ncbi:hypothetical protein K040078D81_56720 [Blautia hominis]|uniref:Uncharacterized protein n=1 Tax=Blautia hominis TaxID=2025493 RepID=A0ABQ0BJB0_9FIRM
MKRNRRRIVSAMLCILLVLSNIVYVSADVSNDLGTIVDGSKLTNDKFSESVESTLVRGNILNQGVARITDNENGSVNIYGAVLGSVTCDKLTLSLTLQRYSNGYWYNIETYSDSASNTSSMSRSYNVSVASGYYYRVKAACVAKKGSTTESKTPTTDGIWIG